MALGTVIKKIKDRHKNASSDIGYDVWAILPPMPRPRILGGLTVRILAVNVIAPLVLVVGLLYLGQYRDSLIRAELETMQIQSQLFAGAIAEAAVRPVEKGKPFFFAKPEEIEMLVPELSRRMVRRLGQTTENRTRLFSGDGALIGDSLELGGERSGEAMVAAARSAVAAESEAAKPSLSEQLNNWGQAIIDWIPMQSDLPDYPDTGAQSITAYPDAAVALTGRISATAWEDRQGKIRLTAAAPIRKVENVIGVVMLSRDGREIESAITQMRYDVLTVFLGALSITIFLSMYLAGSIGRPLKKLARAAEAVRLGKGRQIDIPDLTHRKDEIGELSAALNAMTTALRDRMDTIERFAADVSHEIKNPLTSLRSAVETAPIVKSKADLDRLFGIMQHDVNRLNRLISDISNASRLDAELSREEMGNVNVGRMLTQIIDGRRVALAQQNRQHAASGVETLPSDQRLRINIDSAEAIIVRGSEGRLAQVFENLLSNALSFTPVNKSVTLNLSQNREQVLIQVEDEGPGIPENKLDTIFERFYSERPAHEDYGSHSGLGLSIARQIVKAHGGVIFAENIRDRDNQIRGARFTVVFNRA
ncbi:stimulus-sensing domain-containing protein [Micavibrio aeruginosavorus]|uniref:stimulus-sensing domain-containing protein n=1 Tax=Micavibrio aeruginosavorus TaxID=349221 RepID=UPI003F4ADDC2